MQPRSGSLRRWLSRWLAMLTFLGLGGVCLAVYYATNLNLQTRQEALLQQKMEVIRHLVDENAATGDSTTLRHKLSDFFYGRPDFSLVLEIDGAKTAFGADIAEDEDHAHERRIMFSLPAPGTPGDAMHAELVLDITSDLHLRAALAWTLIACAFVGAAAVSGIAALLVRRAMAPWTSWGGRRRGWRRTASANGWTKADSPRKSSRWCGSSMPCCSAWSGLMCRLRASTPTWRTRCARRWPR